MGPITLLEFLIMIKVNGEEKSEMLM